MLKPHKSCTLIMVCLDIHVWGGKKIKRKKNKQTPKQNLNLLSTSVTEEK